MESCISNASILTLKNTQYFVGIFLNFAPKLPDRACPGASPFAHPGPGPQFPHRASSVLAAPNR